MPTSNPFQIGEHGSGATPETMKRIEEIVAERRAVGHTPVDEFA